MPETEVEQQPANTEAVKEEKKDLVDESAKIEDGSEKKDEAEKKEKTEPEQKEKKKKCTEKKVKEVVPPPPAVHKKDFEKDVVYLYQFNRTTAIPSMSRYCLKVETWLKLNGIKYENVAHNSKLRSKRGLLPFVELNGEEICDSEIIIKTLAAKFGKDMDEGLTNDQKNIQHATIAMVQNHLHWSVSHWMNKDPDNMLKGLKLNLQTVMGSKLPNGLLNFVFKHTYVRKGIKKVKSTSFAGYTAEEIEEAGKGDLKVLSEMLGDKQFFFGDDPHFLDLVTFVQLAILLAVDPELPCPLRDYINGDCKNLVGLYTRMKDRAWGDHWEEAIGDKMELNPHIPKPDPPKEEPKVEEAKDNKEEEKKEEEKEKGDKDEKEKEDNKEEEKK